MGQDIVSRAQTYAARKHAGQTDKVGVTYIHHVADVARRLEQFNDPELVAIGWLHDVIEDTDTPIAEIEEQFGKRVRDGVEAMTNREEDDYFDDYMPRVLASDDARRVKIADVSHNWGKAHLLRASDPDKALALNDKYRRALLMLDVDPADHPQNIVFRNGRWEPA